MKLLLKRKSKVKAQDFTYSFKNIIIRTKKASLRDAFFIESYQAKFDLQYIIWVLTLLFDNLHYVKLYKSKS